MKNQIYFIIVFKIYMFTSLYSYRKWIAFSTLNTTTFSTFKVPVISWLFLITFMQYIIIQIRQELKFYFFNVLNVNFKIIKNHYCAPKIIKPVIKHQVSEVMGWLYYFIKHKYFYIFTYFQEMLLFYNCNIFLMTSSYKNVWHFNCFK